MIHRTGMAQFMRDASELVLPPSCFSARGCKINCAISRGRARHILVEAIPFSCGGTATLLLLALDSNAVLRMQKSVTMIEVHPRILRDFQRLQFVMHIHPGASSKFNDLLLYLRLANLVANKQ